MKKIITILLVNGMILFAGCTFIPQQVDFDPKISVMKTQEGEGVFVAVRVVDERPSKSLGRRGTGIAQGAEIEASQDLAVIVHDKIVAGLKAMKFETLDYSDDKAVSLTVQLRLLEYSTSVGFFTGGVHVNGAVKAIAKKNGKLYERMYRTDDEKRVLFVPGSESNEKMINDSLSSLLSQLFEDRALIDHLAN